MTNATSQTLEAPQSEVIQGPPASGPPVATGTIEPELAGPFWASALAAVALLAVFALALLNDAKPGPADQLTLPILGLFAALFAWTPLQRKIMPQRETATFALCAALFVVYGLSRRTVPESLPSFSFQDETYRFSCAAWCVFLGAVLSFSAWTKALGGWLRAFLITVALLFALALFSYWFIGGYYPASSPTPANAGVFVQLAMQALEFAALALCCASVAAHERTRQLMLMILPLLLWAVWARHRFMPVPLEEEEE